MAEIGRLLTAMITPFDEEGEVSYEQARRLAKGLVDSGSDGLVIGGTTGEAPSMSDEEKVRLFAEVKEEVGDTAAVIAGTTDNNTANSIGLSKQAEALGVDAILATVPAYNKPTQEGLYRHFVAIAEAVSLPCLLYNVPGRTSLNMTDATVVALSHVENIVGVKEASDDFDQISRIIRDTPDSFRVWSGNDNVTLYVMAAGGYGVVSVAGHLVATQIKGLIASIVAGDLVKAGSEHRRLLEMFKILFLVSNPAPVKYAVGNVGFRVGQPRLPLVAPDEHTVTQLNAVISRYKIDLKEP